MIRHYITVALRNLRKYPTQTIISVLGLAAGFVCLSLSALWMHYENTYDTMHEDYERIYTFQEGKYSNVQGEGLIGNRLLASSYVYQGLKTYPEVEAICAARMREPMDGVIEGTTLYGMDIDERFPRFFDIPLIEGDFGYLDSKEQLSGAISEPMARFLFPDATQYVGKKIPYLNRGELTVAAVYKPFDAHSIFADYNMLWCSEFDDGGYSVRSILTIFAKLYDGIDIEAFRDKVYNMSAPYRFLEKDYEGLHTATIPLVQAHRHGGNYLSLRYAHLQNFTLCSTLLVACALINFLVLYLIRLRGRQREMALRMVNGATSWDLLKMFAIEYGIVLILSVVIGVVLVEWTCHPFAHFASIGMGGGYIQLQSLYYMLGIAAVCLVISMVPIAVVRRRTLHRSLSARQSGGTMRKVSLFIQLTTSIAFIFCTIVMLRQVQFLRNNDWGYAIKGRAFMYVLGTRDSHQQFSMESERELDQQVMHQIRLFPMTTNVRDIARTFNDFSLRVQTYEISTTPEGECIEAVMMPGFWDIGHPDYGFTVVEGILPREENWTENQLVITENTCRALGWDTAVGRMLYLKSEQEAGEVVAVIKNIYTGSFMEQPAGYIFLNRQFYRKLYPTNRAWVEFGNYFTISYEPNMRKEFDISIEDMMSKNFPDIIYEIYHQEDILADKLKSETNLMLILGIITLVCILVAIFGVYSIVTLACAQRRKEIALRKIHGATLHDILGIFVKEYGLIVLAASAVAFPIGYIIMKQWIVQYVKQAPIAWWIYVSIFLAIVLLIALSVGSRVWRTVRENPAEVVKSGN